MSAEGQTYRVDTAPAAGRDLKKLKNNQQVLESIKNTIDKLGANPRPNGVEQLSGRDYRVRDGEFRIVYEIDDESKVVTVNKVRDRKEVYKH